MDALELNKINNEISVPIKKIDLGNKLIEFISEYKKNQIKIANRYAERILNIDPKVKCLIIILYTPVNSITKITEVMPKSKFLCMPMSGINIFSNFMKKAPIKAKYIINASTV